MATGESNPYNALQDASQNGQIIDNLPCSKAYTMPNWVQLSSYNHVEAPVQRTIQRPIIKFQSGIGFAKLPNANLHTFKDAILNVSHSICHWNLKLDDLGFLASF